MKAEYLPHKRGKRKFLPIREGIAIMVKGTIGEEVDWYPLPFLGRNSGFYHPYSSAMWHLCYRGRRIW